mmetsp:Transcript_27061/g.43325  ORF Transcript_27061/g.43325 Transcript_27061/m.43325 type:complete len:88 (-) Transcript_27061:111-374(-)
MEFVAHAGSNYIHAQGFWRGVSEGPIVFTFNPFSPQGLRIERANTLFCVVGLYRLVHSFYLLPLRTSSEGCLIGGTNCDFWAAEGVK